MYAVQILIIIVAEDKTFNDGIIIQLITNWLGRQLVCDCDMTASIVGASLS